MGNSFIYICKEDGTVKSFMSKGMRILSGGIIMSAPRSVSVLTGESLVWVKANHQPSTKPHIWSGNRLCEAEGQEVSGCNASEGIEHRNNHRVGGRYCSLSSRQYFHNRYGEIMETRRCLRPQQDTTRS